MRIQSHDSYRQVRASFAGAILLIFGCAISPGVSWAQDEGRDQEVVEEVIVTGSLIRRSAFDAERSPLQVLDQVAISENGGSQVSELLADFTVNTGSEVLARGRDRGGISQFNVRGLWVSSTLVLANGVLTDGASATYGADAVAGVVNFITRKGFEGVELTADYRDSVNENYSISMAAGGKFDRGSANAGWSRSTVRVSPPSSSSSA